MTSGQLHRSKTVYKHAIQTVRRPLLHGYAVNMTDSRTSHARPGLFYDIPRSLPLAIGLPLVLGFASGKVTQTSVKTWCEPVNALFISTRPDVYMYRSNIEEATAWSTAELCLSPRVDFVICTSRWTTPSFAARPDHHDIRQEWAGRHI